MTASEQQGRIIGGSFPVYNDRVVQTLVANYQVGFILPGAISSRCNKSRKRYLQLVLPIDGYLQMPGWGTAFCKYTQAQDTQTGKPTLLQKLLPFHDFNFIAYRSGSGAQSQGGTACLY